MAGDRNVRQSSSWRTRAGAFGVAVATGLALTPLAMTVTTPVAVQAGMFEQVPDPCDFTTSGGFVVTDSGKKANFGAHGGCKHGEFWGHLNYVDHSNGYHVNSVEITAYLAPMGVASPVRDICGIAQTNHPDDPEYVNFRVRLVDNGEPGSGDQFAIKLSNGYWVKLRSLGAQKPGGNVQLHDANASTALAADDDTACGGVRFSGGVE